VTCQPSYPHDDHLHVRWFCSAEDAAAGCQEQAPLYPWFSAAMARAGITPTLATKRAAREKAEVTTQAEADQAVKSQSPHADVLAFLARRKAWEKQPHPGRPYCR
jgi:penicillin-insensitive murein DD-endopeptidase